jgi:hypothetical protein
LACAKADPPGSIDAAISTSAGSGLVRALRERIARNSTYQLDSSYRCVVYIGRQEASCPHHIVRTLGKSDRWGQAFLIQGNPGEVGAPGAFPKSLGSDSLTLPSLYLLPNERTTPQAGN